MDDSKQDLFLESFTRPESVTESYYTYTSPNQSPGPSPTFSRKDIFNVTNNLSISQVPSLGGLSNSRFSLERTIQSEAFEENVEETADGVIPWRSILFGFLLIAGIVGVTSFIIIFPRSTKVKSVLIFNS